MLELMEIPWLEDLMKKTLEDLMEDCFGALVGVE